VIVFSVDYIVFTIATLGLRLKSGDVTNLEESISGYDCAVVFYSGFDPKLMAPDAETMRRITVAINLYKANLVRNLVFCGHSGRLVLENKGAGLMSEIAVKKGVDESRIFFDSNPGDRVDTIRTAAGIISKNGFQSAVFISSMLDINAMSRHVRKKHLLRGFSGFRVSFYAYENIAQYGVPGSRKSRFIRFHRILIEYSAETISWLIERLKWKLWVKKMQRGR